MECIRFYEKTLLEPPVESSFSSESWKDHLRELKDDFKNHYEVTPLFGKGECIPRAFEIKCKGKTTVIRNYFPGLDIKYTTGEVVVMEEYKQEIVIIKQNSKEFKDKIS